MHFESQRDFPKGTDLWGSEHSNSHNHPSHDTTPSKDDDIAASKISEAGKLMKIQLVDFIIIGNGYFSYAEEKRISF